MADCWFPTWRDYDGDGVVAGEVAFGGVVAEVVSGGLDDLFAFVGVDGGGWAGGGFGGAGLDLDEYYRLGLGRSARGWVEGDDVDFAAGAAVVAGEDFHPGLLQAAAGGGFAAVAKCLGGACGRSFQRKERGERGAAFGCDIKKQITAETQRRGEQTALNAFLCASAAPR